MLIDVLNGWFSANFVNNVVKDPAWISGFAYINAAAIGLSSWLLVQPIWSNAIQIRVSDKRKSIILMSTSILLVAIATTTIPVIYHSIQNPFATKFNSGEKITYNNAPPDITMNSGEKADELPFFMTRMADESDLRYKSKWELEVMRNEIFARYGRRFKRSDLQTYFNGQTWYQPQYAPDEFPLSLLTSIQQRNVDFILKYQNRKYPDKESKNNANLQ